MAHTVGTQGSGVLIESRQIDRLALSRSRDLHRVGLWTGDLDRADSVAAIRQGGARARGARICDYEQRIGVAKSDGIDGAVWRAATYRWLCHAHWLFVQSGRFDALSRDGIRVCRASRRDDHGWHMAFGQQIIMMLTLMLTSKGVAGVPRASLVILLAALN